MNKQHKDPSNHKQEQKRQHPQRRQWPRWPKEEREEMWLWAMTTPDEAAGETQADVDAKLAKLPPDVAAQLAEIRRRRPDLVAKLAEERSRRSKS